MQTDGRCKKGGVKDKKVLTPPFLWQGRPSIPTCTGFCLFQRPQGAFRQKLRRRQYRRILREKR